MNNPVIGITTRIGSIEKLAEAPAMRAYCQAIRSAGGEPRILPANLHAQPAEITLAEIDGLLLSGGGDIDPALYGGDTRLPYDDVVAERDELELKLFEYARRQGMPLIGVCRGIQVVNVALGGTLYVDIPSQLGSEIPHSSADNLPGAHPAHEVRLTAIPWLGGTGSARSITVNSRHHQGIQTPGKDLHVLGNAPDGLIEAVQIADHPFGYAVQWHPENLTDEPVSAGLFAALIQFSRKGGYNTP